MVKIQRSIDRYLGGALCTLLSPFVAKKGILPPKKILLIKLWAMGESILTLPLIHELKKKFPKSRIDVLARKRNAQVYEGNKDVTQVIHLENLSTLKRMRAYDLAIDCEPYLNLSALLALFLGEKRIGFSHGIRAGLYTKKVPYNDSQHAVLTYLDLLQALETKATAKAKLIPVTFVKEDMVWADDFLKKENLKKKLKIAVCAGAAESAHTRMWPAEKYAQALEKIAKEYNAAILLVGGKSDTNISTSIKEKIHAKVYDLTGKTTLKQLAALLSRCNLMISNDTGPMHLAAAQGIPTIGLFCPNTPVRFAPYGKKNISIYKPVLQKPCINVHKGQVPDCKKHNHMSNIEVEDVLNAVKKVLPKTFK